MKLMILAVVVLVEVGFLCWTGGYVFGRRGATRAALAAQAARASAYQAAQERERAAGEVQRQHILRVDVVRFVDPRLANDPWAQVEFRVTNRTGKAVNEVDGGIQLYGPGHRPLGIVGANFVEPLAIGGSVEGRTRWTLLDDATRSALVDGKATADYHADQVFYADGAMQRFGQPLPDSDFISAPTSATK